MGQLSGVDLAIVLASIALTVAVGLALGRTARSARGFLVGERDLPWPAILLSIVATETSAVTFLSVPGLAFGGDLRFLQIPLGYVLGRVAIAWLLLPKLFEGDALTSYEVLGRRFGSGVKRASSLLFIAMRCAADGLRLYLTAIPIQALTGWPIAGSILAMAALTVAYTWVGGIRAVVWTDVAQFAIYLAGGLLVLFVAADGVSGGLGGVLDVARAHGKLRVIDASWFDADGALRLGEPYLLWAGLLGGSFFSLATHGTDQLMVQRLLCARSRRDAGRAVVASGIVALLQFALFLAVGLALFAWFREHPPRRTIGKDDEALSVFLVERLTLIPGAAGLVVGAVLAVSLSTLSSSLSALASSLWNDWIAPLSGARSEQAALRGSRAAVVLFAVILSACALGGVLLEESVVGTVLAIASFTTGPTLGLFLLARALPRPANEAELRAQGRAALLAFVAMLGAMTWIWIATTLAWPWYAVLGSLGTLALGRAVAAFTRSGASPTTGTGARA